MKKRFRATDFTTNLISPALFKQFKRVSPKEDITWKEFQQIWDMIAEVYMDMTVEETDGTRLGFYLGDLSIQYVNLRKVLEKHSRKVPLNLSTDGKVGKVVLTLGQVRRYNKYSLLFGFKACNRFTKKANHKLMTTPQKFKDYQMKKSQIHKKLKTFEQFNNKTGSDNAD